MLIQKLLIHQSIQHKDKQLEQVPGFKVLIQLVQQTKLKTKKSTSIETSINPNQFMDSFDVNERINDTYKRT